MRTTYLQSTDPVNVHKTVYQANNGQRPALGYREAKYSNEEYDQSYEHITTIDAEDFIPESEVTSLIVADPFKDTEIVETTTTTFVTKTTTTDENGEVTVETETSEPYVEE